MRSGRPGSSTGTHRHRCKKTIFRLRDSHRLPRRHYPSAHRKSRPALPDRLSRHRPAPVWQTGRSAIDAARRSKRPSRSIRSPMQSPSPFGQRHRDRTRTRHSASAGEHDRVHSTETRRWLPAGPCRFFRCRAGAPSDPGQETVPGQPAHRASRRQVLRSLRLMQPLVPSAFVNRQTNRLHLPSAHPVRATFSPDQFCLPAPPASGLRMPLRCFFPL